MVRPSPTKDKSKMLKGRRIPKLKEGDDSSKSQGSGDGLELPKSEEPGMFLKTLNPIIKYTFKWEIRELSKINLKQHESQMFEVEPESVWYAYLFKDNERIELKLNWYSKNAHPTVNYIVGISDGDDKELYRKSASFAHYRESCAFSVFDTDIDGKIVDPPKDTLVIKIDLAVIGEITQNVPLDYPQPNITLQNALETEFLQSDEAKDIEDTKTKSIFFINLLSSMSIRKAKELEETSLTELRGILASVNNKLLKDVDVKSVTGLYEVAGEYSLEDLKNDCGRALLSKVTSKNAQELFNLLKE